MKNSPAPATKIDQSNVGDACVVILDDKSSQSACITDVLTSGTVRVSWYVGPGGNDYRYLYLRPEEFNRITLFPKGSKFLVV